MFLMAAALLPLMILAAPTATSDTSRVQPTRQPDKEIVYKKTPQGELKLFVYLPTDWKAGGGGEKPPTILFFFGGGGGGGGPPQFFRKAVYSAPRGMVAVCAEYRISSVHQTGVKECVLDVRSAMRFLRKHAGEWGIDPEKIVAAGGSAGGHLSATLTFPNSKETDEPTDDATISCRPQAMVLFNPVMDLVAAFEDVKTAEIMRRNAPGDGDEEKKRFLRTYSPIEHLAKDLPPALILYGDQDTFLAAARVYAEKSRGLGNKIELSITPNVGHGFFNGQPWHGETLKKADAFLVELGILNSQ